MDGFCVLFVSFYMPCDTTERTYYGYYSHKTPHKTMKYHCYTISSFFDIRMIMRSQSICVLFCVLFAIYLYRRVSHSFL